MGIRIIPVLFLKVNLLLINFVVPDKDADEYEESSDTSDEYLKKLGLGVCVF